jgi:endonuclease/exonuclease/phosphatase family metal-dependent hydrolase
MKIAAYNVENLFERAKAFNDNSDEAKAVVKKVADLTTLLEKKQYTSANKKKILELMEELGILKTDEGPFVILRKVRGQFIKRPRTNGTLEIIADGRADWIGWVELKKAHVNETAIMNTGRVIRDVNADILAVIEAENRVALKQFSDYVLKKVEGTPYTNVMLIDGNDDRGIDVGLMTKSGYDIGRMQSHIHDLRPDGRPIFSRDCPEYCVTTPERESIWILPNHFKSKFGGNNPQSRKNREAQAIKTAEIYQRLINEGYENVVVLGDLNDTPDSIPLQPLLAQTDLQDISAHPSFDTGEYEGIGTFGLGNDSNKIDYLLLSPALFARITACGIFRKGAWPGKNPKRWTVYDELTEEIHVASDHHVVWCEIE